MGLIHFEDVPAVDPASDKVTVMTTDQVIGGTVQPPVSP
jgi:hypothetical protein